MLQPELRQQMQGNNDEGTQSLVERSPQKQKKSKTFLPRRQISGKIVGDLQVWKEKENIIQDIKHNNMKAMYNKSDDDQKIATKIKFDTLTDLNREQGERKDNQDIGELSDKQHVKMDSFGDNDNTQELQNKDARKEVQ